jgi:hypothetical protein
VVFVLLRVALGIVTAYRLDRQQVGIRISTSSRQVLRLTQPSIQWVPGALSLGLKRPGGEADHALAISAHVKKTPIYTAILPYFLLA